MNFRNRKKAVKVRKWVTCAEPGCGRRAGTSKPYCGEHLEQFEKKKAAAAARRKMNESILGKSQVETLRRAEMKRKKPAKKKTQKSMTAAAKKRIAAAAPSSRLIKADCEKCGYTIRLSRKWIEIRRPICPTCKKNMATEIDGETGDSWRLKLKGVKKTRAKGGV